MTHINVSVRSPVEQDLDLQIATLTAQRDFWRQEARHARSELANIPDALDQLGECEIRDADGKVWHLQLDPHKHPKTES